MQWTCSHKLTYQLIIGLLLVTVLTSCAAWGWGTTPTPTLEPSFIDSSILTSIPCAAPCWYGLEIGRSTKADILATAQTLSFVDPKGFPEDPSSYFDRTKGTNVPATLIRLNCRQPEGWTCASLLMVNDVLKQIYLSPPPSLNFSEVVTHLGPPEYVKIYPVPGSGVLCNVALIWKQRGIWVAFLTGTPQKTQVRCQDVRGGKSPSPNLPIDQIIYESPDDFANVPESGADFPWSGFAQP